MQDLNSLKDQLREALIGRERAEEQLRKERETTARLRVTIRELRKALRGAP